MVAFFTRYAGATMEWGGSEPIPKLMSAAVSAILLKDILTESVCSGTLQFEYCYGCIRGREVGGQVLGGIQPR